MIYVLLILWIICSMLIIVEHKIYRIFIYFGIFSLITAACYMLMGAPDVALAEIGISAFSTILFIVCVEKYYSHRGGIAAYAAEHPKKLKVGKWVKRFCPPLVFSAVMLGLFIYFIPGEAVSTYLKYQYLGGFMSSVGGQNAVTAIYLGYRVYDTLFEALILVVAVVAVSHMSWSSEESVADGHHSEIENYSMAIFTLRIICPIILVFGAYVIMNGHISAGGGFQGGLVIASFFICRYLIYGIYDIPIKKIIKLEELVFINIIIVAVIAVFLGTGALIPGEFSTLFQDVYLIAMNIMIGLKVACGFTILFYRFVAIERREEVIA